LEWASPDLVAIKTAEMKPNPVFAFSPQWASNNIHPVIRWFLGVNDEIGQRNPGMWGIHTPVDRLFFRRPQFYYIFSKPRLANSCVNRYQFRLC